MSSMSKMAVVALDVGGTTVDSACVSAAGDVIGGLVERGSPAAGTRDQIVAELAGATAAARDQAGDAEVLACGVAMPGPFDYEAGVSNMGHKFQAVRGVNLRAALEAETGLPTYFINDASAFGLGVAWLQLPDTRRFVALTIGTGLGSSFIEDGGCVETGARVPPGGEVWDLPFEGGILEDRVSARGVVALYDELRPGERRSAKDVSDLARRGSQPAVAAYRAMGAALGAGLAPVLARFAPERVVIGGKVGQSLALFLPGVQRALAASGLPELPVLPAASGNLAIWGAARHSLSRAAARGAGQPLQ
jgi:glucokinase